MNMEDIRMINKNFLEAHRDVERLTRAVRKNKRKIKWMKVGLIGLAIYCAGLAVELAERKRSENYLQEEIDKLKEEIHGVEVDEDDGGSADA